MELPTSSQNWSWEGAWLRSTLTVLPCLLLMLPIVVAQLCLTLCDPMDCSTPGFLVLHHLLEFAQAHVHWVSDAIQSSHPLLPASPPAFNLSQHQGLFYESALCIRCQITGASASALVLPTNIQGWFPLGLTSLQPLALSLLFGAVNVRI